MLPTLTRLAILVGDLNLMKSSTATVSKPSSTNTEISPPKNNKGKGAIMVLSYRYNCQKKNLKKKNKNLTKHFVRNAGIAHSVHEIKILWTVTQWLHAIFQEFTYYDTKNLTSQKEVERRSKTFVPSPPIVSNLQFLMRAVICKEFVLQDQTIKVGFPEIWSCS